MARWILISDSNSQVSCKVKLPFSRELPHHHHHAPQPNSQIRPPHKIICVILTCKTAIFVADDRPGKCFITKFYNDNENMLQSYLLHLTVDSILLTSQEMSMTQDTCIWSILVHLHQRKRRPKENLCNWGQLALSSEMLKVPEVMLVPCGSLSGCIDDTKLQVCVAFSGVGWKDRWMVDGLAKAKLLQCRRSLHRFIPSSHPS